MALADIGSIAQWTALESLGLFAAEPEQADAIKQAIAAASQLPRLHTLKLPDLRLGTSSQLWAQLASMPALRSLELDNLHVESATVPSASIRRLKATLDLQLPAEQLDGCLAALLPALEQLQGRLVTDDGIQRFLRALANHPSMQRLTFATGKPPQPWSQQYLRSMPQLRALELSDVRRELLGALLEDAAACAQLQELQVATSFTKGTSSSWAGQGLAALASGPCRHSLRSIKIRLDRDDTIIEPVAASFAQAAPLLLPGALPQLRELQLDVRVHAGSLLPHRSARLQQARAGAAATQRPPQEEPPGSPEQHLQLLVGGLQQAGVQGLGGFRLARGLDWFRNSVRHRAFEGRVGPCRFSGLLRVVW